MIDLRAGQHLLTSLGPTRLFGSSATASNESFSRGGEAYAAQPQIDPEQISKLKRYSVATAEELYGLAAATGADRFQAVFGRVLPGLDARLITERITRVVGAPTLDAYKKLRIEKFGRGARIQLVAGKEPPGSSSVSGMAGAGAPGNQFVLPANCMPPVKHQGNRGTCVAFATCAVVEYLRCRADKGKQDFSEQFQFWHCKQYDGDPSAEGTYPDLSFRLFEAEGCCEEKHWPYNPASLPGNVAHIPSPIVKSAAGWNVPMMTAKRVELTPPTDVAVLKAKLKQGYPIAFAIPVFNSWENNPHTYSTGAIPMPLPGEVPTDGHAMVLVGYSDEPQYAGGGYFVFRNSWGTGWAARCPYGPGNGTIPYAFINLYNYSAHTVQP